VLDDYLDSALIETAEGVTLRYPAQWEARIFELSPHDLWPVIRRLEIPALFIRGADSDTFSGAAAKRLGRIGPPVEVMEVPGAGHLVPMEKPEQLGRLVTGFICEHQAHL
jgi:pimeloyl-ACP methyl ester carboxylesterase